MKIIYAFIFKRNSFVFQIFEVDMCVLIVTGSMRKPPQNCSIQGLELLPDILSHGQYEELKRRLELEAEPYPSQLVYVNMVPARVLTILMNFRMSIVSQSQDSKGNFITWTLVMPPPIIRRSYAKTNLEDVDKFNNNVNESRLDSNARKEVRVNNGEMSQILVKKIYN